MTYQLSKNEFDILNTLITKPAGEKISQRWIAETSNMSLGTVNKTVKELAQLTNYSVSGFEKKFKRVFNTSAGNWLKQQKSTIIFNDISNGSDSFKNISYQNGFSSISHFNNYCKLHFSKTPGEIRRAGKKEN